tara:strand:+ start:3957 stop:4784 length:828 start_codon:yes stop_codon:yes gene_type:complete
MKQSVWTNKSNPQAFVTKDKQRLKQFEGEVYLKDGDEYQIELFNPTQNHILAKIKIDSDYISGGGIVLRPGERTFLQRFLDTNNKFVFRTYEVDKEAIEVGATSNNGYVEVEFYNEIKNSPSNNGLLYGNGTTTTFNSTGTPLGMWGGTTTTGNATFTTTSTGTAAYSNINASYTASPTSRRLTGELLSHINGIVEDNSLLETGITEKGGKSSQKFETSDRNFLSVSFHNVAWRLLPFSKKILSTNELNILYCGGCGAKRKKDSHKFCPHCGTEY